MLENSFYWMLISTAPGVSDIRKFVTSPRSFYFSIENILVVNTSLVHIFVSLVLALMVLRWKNIVPKAGEMMAALKGYV